MQIKPYLHIVIHDRIDNSRADRYVPFTFNQKRLTEIENSITVRGIIVFSDSSFIFFSRFVKSRDAHTCILCAVTHPRVHYEIDTTE